MTIKDIKDLVLENTNGLLEKAAYIFENKYQFLSSGVSDKYGNMLYFRPVDIGQRKFSVKEDDNGIVTISSRWRMVVQMGKDYQNVTETMINILLTVNEISLISYSDDTDGVYKAEYGDKEVVRDFNLWLFDFEFRDETARQSTICECITKGSC